MITHDGKNKTDMTPITSYFNIHLLFTALVNLENKHAGVWVFAA